MQIIEKRLEELRPYEHNPRKNDEAVEKVAASIKQFGFNVPIMVDHENVIIAGHTRLKAAEALGMKKVPVLVVDDLEKPLIDQLRLVDNKVAELSSWDFEKLMIEMSQIQEIDLDIFGFGDFESSGNEGSEPRQQVDGKEIDLGDFDDDKFLHECPYCGFQWNE